MVASRLPCFSSAVSLAMQIGKTGCGSRSTAGYMRADCDGDTMKTPARERDGRIALAMLLLSGFVGHARSQAPAPIHGQDPEAFKIAVSVDLVVLDPTVRDRKGSFASDVREQDFEVYEDGVRQSIRLFKHEDIPVTVGLVIDHSGSMHQKLPDVVAAART